MQEDKCILSRTLWSLTLSLAFRSLNGKPLEFFPGLIFILPFHSTTEKKIHERRLKNNNYYKWRKVGWGMQVSFSIALRNTTLSYEKVGYLDNHLASFILLIHIFGRRWTPSYRITSMRLSFRNYGITNNADVKRNFKYYLKTNQNLCL